MAVRTVTLDTFESTVTEPGMVFLDCWADWCPPCRAFKPVFENAAEKHTDAIFASIDTQKEQVLAGQLGISSIPTIMAFRDGIMVFNQPGAMGAPDFERVIQAVRGLNMDEVRAQIETQATD
ncbi:MAG: thioredoxin family protein [Propionibacteriaceae bacterium]|jgi:thioredoxin 1|nr:thioredoxin family protein [Propionibacteriaceae bacterium]